MLFCKTAEVRVDSSWSSLKNAASDGSELFAIAVVLRTPVWILRYQSLTRRSVVNGSFNNSWVACATLLRRVNAMIVVMSDKKEPRQILSPVVFLQIIV